MFPMCGMGDGRSVAIMGYQRVLRVVGTLKNMLLTMLIVHTAVQRWTVTTMADETGTVLPWEKDAMAGLEMPDGLSYPDQILYLELRMLYNQYYQKVIDRETATKEKKKLLDEYRVNQFREEMGKQWVEVTRLTEIARADYRKNPCNENAMKLIEIIEGRNL